MQNEISVSVIVATYNFNMLKTVATLNSIIHQKNVSIEIIIADDGSGNSDELDSLNGYFEKNNITNFKIIKNKENQGTVKNLLSGLNTSVGKYIYFISPGDCLFDDMVLSDFFEFCEKRNSKIAFGNAVSYTIDENNNVNILDVVSGPRITKCYEDGKSLNYQKISFWTNNITGPAYFRERTTICKYLSFIQNHCKFVEDNTTTAAALADGIRIDYFDRNLVWYDYGTGVSAPQNEKWKKILMQDFDRNLQVLSELHPDDSVIKNQLYLMKNRGSSLKKLISAFRHPYIYFVRIKNKFVSARKINWTVDNKKHLENFYR